MDCQTGCAGTEDCVLHCYCRVSSLETPLHSTPGTGSRWAFARVLQMSSKAAITYFLQNTLAAYREIGVEVKGLMTDNGPAYRSRRFNAVLPIDSEVVHMCYKFAEITVVLNPSSGLGATKYFVTSSNISSVSVSALWGCSIRLFAICPKQISSGRSM